MGIVTQDMASVFKTKYVDALFSKQRYKLIKEPLFVFIGCDPNGGGTCKQKINILQSITNQKTLSSTFRFKRYGIGFVCNRI